MYIVLKFECFFLFCRLFGYLLKQIYPTIKYVLRIIPNLSNPFLLHSIRIRLFCSVQNKINTELNNAEKTFQYDGTAVFDLKNTAVVQMPASIGYSLYTTEAIESKEKMIKHLHDMNNADNSRQLNCNLEETEVKAAFSIGIPNTSDNSHQTSVKYLEVDTSEGDQDDAQKIVGETDLNISTRDIQENVLLQESFSFEHRQRICRPCVRLHKERTYISDRFCHKYHRLGDNNTSDVVTLRKFVDICQKDGENSVSSIPSKSMLYSLFARDKESSCISNPKSCETTLTDKLIDINLKGTGNLRKCLPVEETTGNDCQVEIVTSLSHYKYDIDPSRKLEKNDSMIEHFVKRFFLSNQQRRHKPMYRSVLRRLRRSITNFRFLKPPVSICCPLHTTTTTSNFVVREENSQSEPILERNLTNTSNHEVYDTAHFSSIFNDVSIENLREPRYNIEWMRLASFARFDSHSVQAIPLAKNGWYSTGNRAQTVCFSCHRMHQNWKKEENPNEFHDRECR